MDRTLHHGTMLIDLDKSAANSYLNPSLEKLKSKGVESVKARIMNLTEVNPLITHDKFCAAMKSAFKRKHKGKECEEKILREEECHKIPEIEQIFGETSSWGWRFGETPEFSFTTEKKYDWGLVELCLNVQNAMIQNGKVYSDCLYPDFIDTFNGILAQAKVPYTREGWSTVMAKIESACGSNQMYLKYLSDVNVMVHEKL